MEATDAAGGMPGLFDALLWVLGSIVQSVPNLVHALRHPGLWLDWSDKEAIMRVVYYGASHELFFVMLTLFAVVTGVGLWCNRFMWGCVRVLEGFANTVGRFFAWAGLLMVLQQVVIVFVQRIFARPDIAFGFGIPLQMDISWWSEELKLYNAMVVCLCCTYTFVQGGHVRVDLVYSAVSFRARRVIDMAGSLLFMIPVALVTWLYAWYFLWRHLITPKPSASDTLERLLMKARAVRWNVETIGFSPNGFNGYFLFKLLLVCFAGMVLLQGVAFFYRSWLEWKEGEQAEARYLDADILVSHDAADRRQRGAGKA